MKKQLFFSIMLLMASPVFAIDSAYLKCFNDFPTELKLNITDEFTETLTDKEISNYEQRATGAGYGLHYNKNYLMDLYDDNFCETSLFLYDVNHMNQKLTEQDFTSDSQFAELTSYVQIMSNKEKRERLSAEEAGLPHCEDCPEGSSPVSELYRYKLDGHMVHYTDEFFKDSVERKALMEYDGNYLKLLLTCQALTLDEEECAACLNENQKEDCPMCERDLEFDKDHLDALSNAVLKTAITNLDNCMKKKGN